MCRNIRTLFNFDPPATEAEIQAAALQFVRKVTGTTHPSKLNQAAFDQAVDEVQDVVTRLFAQMTTTAPARDREVEIARAKIRSQQRFGLSP